MSKLRCALRCALGTAIVCLAWSASAICPAWGFDLERARVATLDNGLTVVVLEEQALPVVSVQMLYKVGARTEENGRTGLAHYFEHMAFRASENFPDTEVVSAIYAVGGEWHGYTWIDQTTYFATVPAEHLDLLLRIEADRMARLLVPAADVEAERGAVLAELHGYENDPASILLDAVVATSFQQHPYRNNTIGWESDVKRLEHADLVAWYRRHYHPANGVLAVVGAVSASDVERRVRELFGEFAATGATPPPRTVEPPQRGERRVHLEGAGAQSYFAVAYRAPSVRSTDWPAFLILHEVLGGSEGVNFLQNEWGLPVRGGSRLAGAVEGLATWYPPTQFPYVWMATASVAAAEDRNEVERQIEERLRKVREEGIALEELAAARHRLGRELSFDIETTEDAAHQLATFVAFDALELLVNLPEALAAVTRADVQRVARSYFQPYQRTIGWYTAGDPPMEEPPGGHPQPVPPTSPLVASPTSQSGAVEAPVVRSLSSGLPVIVQRSTLSQTICARVLVAGRRLEFAGDFSVDTPVWRATSLNRSSLASELEAELAALRAALDGATPLSADPSTAIEDPGIALRHAFEGIVQVEEFGVEQGIVAVVVVGDLDPESALESLERNFGDLVPVSIAAPGAVSLVAREQAIQLAQAKAQARLGYVVPAPPPASPEAWAWQLALYILSHGYEGRLGKEAISRRGLIYYIDAHYRTDGGAAVVELDIGVDPKKLEAMRTLMLEELARLRRQPPTDAEVAEAKRHLIGRRRSAAQSNAEISARLLVEWVGQRRLLTDLQFHEAVHAVTPREVREAARALGEGAVVSVEFAP